MCYVAKIFNQKFEKHHDSNINTGELLAIPKPGKPKGPPKNLRPIILQDHIVNNSSQNKTTV